jgi:hypothetical protein
MLKYNYTVHITDFFLQINTGTGTGTYIGCHLA